MVKQWKVNINIHTVIQSKVRQTRKVLITSINIIASPVKYVFELVT